MRYSNEVDRPSGSSNIPLFPRLFISALALSFLVAGIGLFVQHVTILNSWRPVEATVVRSEIIRFRNSKQRDMFRGEVELAYTVAGKDHQTPDTFSYSSSSEATIRRQMEKTYAVGSRHQVFYNPVNPYSFRWTVGDFQFFLLPVAFTGVGLILIVACYYLWRLPFPQRLACARCGNQGRPDDRYCPRCGDSLSPVTSTDQPKESTAEARPLRREKPGVLLLVGAFFGLPGVGCSIVAAYMGFSTYAATQTWPIYDATVARSSIEAVRANDGRPTYRLGVEFDYEGGLRAEHAVGQSMYVSGSYPWILQRLSRFTVGSRHKIRVNPHNRDDIRFDVESPLLNWLPTAGVGLLGIIFVGIGASFTIWGLKPRCGTCRHLLPHGAAFCPACRGTVTSGRSVTGLRQTT